jgi:hypothetical protein
MVARDRLPAASHALHKSFVRLRFLAGEGVDAAELYKILDATEVLLCIMTEQPGDTTREFRAAMNGLGEQFPEFAGLADNFDNDLTWTAPTVE